MERGARLLLASSVLTAGIATALLFRHPTTRVGSQEPGASDVLVLRQDMASDDNHWIPATDRPNMPIGARQPIRGRSPDLAQIPATLTPMDPGDPPPALPRSYWQARYDPVGERDESREELVRTHTIVDGDTLPKLAERYLGSADRSWEIFEANRDKLPAPDLLPIGVELEIPPSVTRPHTGGELVPVPQLRKGICARGSTALRNP
jgi:hypothetical protein